MQVPDSFGNKEVVISELSVVVSMRNVEEGISSIEVKMDSITL